MRYIKTPRRQCGEGIKYIFNRRSIHIDRRIKEKSSQVSTQTISNYQHYIGLEIGRFRIQTDVPRGEISSRCLTHTRPAYAYIRGYVTPRHCAYVCMFIYIIILSQITQVGTSTIKEWHLISYDVHCYNKAEILVRIGCANFSFIFLSFTIITIVYRSGVTFSLCFYSYYY